MKQAVAWQYIDMEIWSDKRWYSSSNRSWNTSHGV